MDKEECRLFLNKEAKKRNSINEVSEKKPDPLLVVYKYKNEHVALLCSMFAYGRASMIVKFLNQLDFSLIDSKSELIIKKNINQNIYYRLQSTEDIKQIFITFQKLKALGSLEELFYEAYKKNHDVMDGIEHIIDILYGLNPYRSRGYQFLIGPEKLKIKGGSAYKRWHLFLRWVVRNDSVDLGLWKKVNKKDLIIPLDTHLHNIGLKLGLLNRKQADLCSALELTNALKEFDKNDPTKYDMALYRIGQEKQL